MNKNMIIVLGILLFINLMGVTDATQYSRVFPKHVDANGKVTMVCCADRSRMVLYNADDAKNPTSVELVKAVMLDKTDQQIYTSNKFDCVDYAKMLHNNMEARGIRSGVVMITYKDTKQGHLCNVFQTTDKGLIYIDNTGSEGKCGKDRFSFPVVGSYYKFISFAGVSGQVEHTIGKIETAW
jgi:hypothetical protein